MVEVITIDEYKQVIKNTDINNISDESIQTAINITTLTLDSVCGSNISKRWPLDETNRLHLTIEQKEYIRNAFILQTKYVLDNNIDFSVGTDQSTNGSSSWSQTRLKREQILPEVYELLQTAGVYYTNAFISTSYSGAERCKCTCPNDFYCQGEKSTPIDLEIGDNRYIKQYNPNARRKWLFSDERGLITYTSTNPERWVLDCVINGESVVEPLTNIASFEMIKDILDENGNSLVNPDTHTVTLDEWLKVDLSNNPNNFTNGVSLLYYQDNQWKEHIKLEGETLGAPIKISEYGYRTDLDRTITKYHCLSIIPDPNNVLEFRFNGTALWNIISYATNLNLNLTANNDDTNLITKTFDDSANKDNNQITFNIAPNQIFERNKALLDQYVSDNFVQVLSGETQGYQHYISTTSSDYSLDHTMNTDGYYSVAFNFVNNVSTAWEQWYQWYQVKYSTDGGNTFVIYEFDSIERPANDSVISEKGWNYQRHLIAGPFKKGTIVRFSCNNNFLRLYPANDGQSSGYNAVVIEKPIKLIKKG